MRTNEICNRITGRLEREHEKLIFGYKKPLLLISAEYPGLWLEHVYDSVIYAELDNSKLYLAENATEVFMDYQKEDGQLPYAVKSGESADSEAPTLNYYQIQECVSFASLCLRVYRMNRSKEYLKKRILQLYMYYTGENEFILQLFCNTSKKDVFCIV